MLTKAFVTAAAAGLLIASSAQAGDGHKKDKTAHTDGAAQSSTTVNSSLSSTPSMNTTGMTADTGAYSNVSATAPMSTSDALAAGGTVQVTASTPVADTPENRALYGEPMSNTGKRTRAAGN